MIGVNHIMTKFLTIIQCLIYKIMNNIPVFLFIYVDTMVTIGTLYIGSYEVSYGYTSYVISVITITIKFVNKQHVL